MRHLLSRPLAGLCACLCALTASLLPAAADDIIWTFGPTSAFTAAPDAPLPPAVTVSDISRGNEGGTSTLVSATSPSANATSGAPDYTGASGAGNAQTVCKTGAFDAATSSYLEFTVTPDAGAGLTLTGLKFGTRRTGTGPLNYSLRHSGDGYAAVIAGGATPADNTWGLITHSGLTFSSPTGVTFRLYGHDGTGSASAANWRIDDLTLTYTPGGNVGPPPTISDFTPLSGMPGSSVTINGTNFGAAPVVRFNGTLATGTTVNPEGTSITTTVPAAANTGTISVSAPGGLVTTTDSFTVIPLPLLSLSVFPGSFAENAANPAATGTITLPEPAAADFTVTLVSSNTASATVPPSVVVPAGQTSALFDVTAVHNTGSFANASVTITASAGGYQNGTVAVTVSNVDSGFPVVINKIYNSGTVANDYDIVELLVLGSGTAGSIADMRRMLLKDFSGNTANDSGGKIRFKDIAAFSAIKAGTLIVLTNNNVSPDTNPDDDWIMRLGLKDTNYFTIESGSFDIGATDMVMIKAQDATAAGLDGGIHAFAAGAAAAQYTDATCRKIRSNETAATGKTVIAINATSSEADFNAASNTDTTKALGNQSIPPADFGKENNPSNKAYILILRGTPSVDGLGTATVKNLSSGSVYLNRDIFARSGTDQTVSIDLLGTGTAILTSATITIPAAFGSPSPGTVSISGAGLGAGTFAIEGQVISITGAALASNAGITVTVTGLNSPDTNTAGNDGRYAFNVQTAGDGGTLKDIGTHPVALVVIPAANTRATDANGVPVMLKKTVALELVCTEEDFDSATRTSAYAQDAGFGINIFIQAVELSLVLGNRYSVRGDIFQFNGLTEIIPAAAADVLDLGTDTEPAPLTVTLATLLAAPESYEGRLVRVNGLNLASGSWLGAGTEADPLAAVTDSTSGTVNIRIQSGSSATTVPSFPINLTGIFGQFDGTSPFTEGYQIMPRSDADVESLGLGAYYGWATLYGVGGPQEDSDGDGVPNMVEYATGTAPNDRNSLNPPVFDFAARSFTVNKGAPGASDTGLQYTVEASTDLQNWNTTNLEIAEDTAARLSVIYTGTEDNIYVRLRLVRP